MLTIGVGHSVLADSAAAGREAASDALASCGGRRPTCVLVFAAFQYFDHMKVLQGVKEVTGDAPLVGGTSSGEISSMGVAERSVVVMALSSPKIHASMGVGTGLAQNARAAGRSAAAEALQGATCTDSKLLILIYAGWLGNIPDVIVGAQDILGSGVPIVGGAAGAGSTADYRPISKQFVGERILSGSVVALLLSGKLKVVTRMLNGAQLLPPPLKLTRTKGNKIMELNHRPAYDVFAQVTSTGERVDSAVTHPLAVLDQYGFTLRTVTSADQEKREVYLIYPEAEQIDVQITTISSASIIAAHEEMTRSALLELKGRTPRGLICFDCSAQKWILGRQAGQEVQAMLQHLGAAPLIGFYSSGEIGTIGTADGNISKFSHLMTSFALLSDA